MAGEAPFGLAQAWDGAFRQPAQAGRSRDSEPLDLKSFAGLRLDDLDFGVACLDLFMEPLP